MFRPLQFAMVAVTLVVSGCRTTQPEPVSHSIEEVKAITSTVAVELLADPKSPRVELGPGEEFVEPYLVKSDPPSYPSRLADLNLVEHYVFVRVRFDEKGRVAEITESPLRRSTESVFAQHFRDAVDATVDSWRCAPSRIRKFGPGPDGDSDGIPDYKILMDQKVLGTYFDVSFRFHIVDGEPAVSRVID